MLATFGNIQIEDPASFYLEPGMIVVRLVLDGGRTALVKAAGIIDQPVAFARLMRENYAAQVLRSSPQLVPVPDLLYRSVTYFDQAGNEAWVVLVFGIVAGRPIDPLSVNDRTLMLDDVETLSAALTRSPISEGFPMERLKFTSWHKFAENPEADRQDSWISDRIERFVAYEDRAATIPATTLSRASLCLSDVIVTDLGISFLSWSHATMTPPWFDELLLRLAVHAATSGVDAFVPTGVFRSDGVSSEDILAVMVGVAGDLFVGTGPANALRLPGDADEIARLGVATRSFLDAFLP